MKGSSVKYSHMQHDDDLVSITDTHTRSSELATELRRLNLSDISVPTFAEIGREVQDGQDQDMGKIDPEEDNPAGGEN